MPAQLTSAFSRCVCSLANNSRRRWLSSAKLRPRGLPMNHCTNEPLEGQLVHVSTLCVVPAPACLHLLPLLDRQTKLVLLAIAI